MRFERLGGLLLVAILAGCASLPSTPAGTGAEETVQTFYEALLREDWARAYAVVHPESKAHCSAERFAELGRTSRRNLGFEPEAVHVRSCQEDGSEARAHIVIAGRSGSHSQSYKDGITLRRSSAGWGVVLPPNFGQPRTP